MRRNIPFLSPGHRVGVPFGKNKLYTGLVYKKHQVAPQTYTPKAIEVILDEYPLVHPQQLAFWEWMSDYYRCTMGNILRTAPTLGFPVDQRNNREKIAEVEVDWETLSDEAFLVMEALEKSDLLVEDIQAIVQRKRILPLIQTLWKWVTYKQYNRSKKNTAPKYHRYFRLHPDHQDEAALNQLFEQLKRAPKQSEFIFGLLQLQEEEQEWVKMSQLKKHA